MLRSFQQLRQSLITCPKSVYLKRYQPLPRILPAYHYDKLYKPHTTAICQRFSFHTIQPQFKEQPPSPEDENVYKRQMLIGFTCTVCHERSHHTMSKHAYTKGVVLIQCPGCKNRHLIADNLGWFKDNKTTVEDLVKEKGEAIRKVIVDEQGIERLGDLMEWLPEITEEEKMKKEQAKLLKTETHNNKGE
ncbi:DNL zinc finger-domain-containing protein [Cokeromyces recurvatus]|uniref:DNL zinc finger-domain-containing protein n=1 Tax=Cokeromyces recurvatus TaxID=90255 RepID=UPI00221E74CE|nr:DNL zinc finger-domain-containing protein [Cokeromyces recurvatus]KAI7899454.1 DNL zinc finger-domain-containing protein [Cokeromyces recurvatus]